MHRNYRNVSLICHASQVMLRIILNRLRQYSERELPEEQAGFRVGRGTRDMLFRLQLVIEKTLELEEKEVRWNGQLTDWFQIGQGTRQGCNVSPT